MRARVVRQQLIRLAHGFDGGRIQLLFLEEDRARRKPFIEVQFSHGSGQLRTNSAKQHGPARPLHFAEEMFQALFDAEHVFLFAGLFLAYGR
jgi:hypothetical protein